MMQLLIQGLRQEYAAIDKALDWAYDSDYCTQIEMDEAYCALHCIIEKLILSSTSYRGMTSADEVARNCALDMRYVTEDSLSEQEMKEREEWHWKRQEELDMNNSTITNNNMKVKVKKLNPAAVIPTKAHPTDAGFDLVATSQRIDEFGNLVFGTGLAFEIPEGYAGYVYPRSSICKQDLAMSNAVGVIDSHYRGEVMVKFRPALYVNRYDSPRSKDESFVSARTLRWPCSSYWSGDRIAQLIVMPLPAVEMVEADELSATDRGEGGYGSTGR